MPYESTTITTPDGDCPAHVFTPTGAGPWPAILTYMDGLGIRPAVLVMGARLAEAGFVVLVPDLYYRHGPYAPLDSLAIHASGDFLKGVGPMFHATDLERAGRDTGAFLDCLQARPDVAGQKVGVVGYCRGGGSALRAAGLYPNRIAAAASFHGGFLVTDEPHSPHRTIAAIQGEVYIAGADQDASYPPGMALALEEALNAAGVAHRCEIYQGARHGWTLSDSPAYEPAADDRHWRELTALMRSALSVVARPAA